MMRLTCSGLALGGHHATRAASPRLARSAAAAVCPSRRDAGLPSSSGAPLPAPLRGERPTQLRRHARGIVQAAKGFGEMLMRRAVSNNGRAPLSKGAVGPPLLVPANIPRPSYADSGSPPPWSEDYQIQDADGIARMRAAGALAADVLAKAGAMVRPGITTNDIDVAVHGWIIAAGAYPSPLNYSRFPKSVCTSLNECICHGIPDSTVLVEGDIINIDVTVFLNGCHGDTSRMFYVGSPAPQHQRLVEATKEALDASIALCAPGVPFKKIGGAIQEVADKYKLGVVRNFVGHGVGAIFHSGPAVLHYRNDAGGKMMLNQTFTIEPMLSIGSTRERVWSDDWTAVTSDGSWTAQFEHTLLITEKGVEVLTKYE